MTVQSQISRITQNGDGVTVTFPVSFYFLADGDLTVIADGVTKTITTDYTVTGAGNPAGGSVTFTSAPASGTGNVVIFRDPDLTQLLDYIENDDFPAESHERGLDKLTMIAQRINDLVSRAVRVSDSAPGTFSPLTPTTDGSLPLIGFTPGGTGIQLYPLSGTPGDASNIVYNPAGTGAVATTVEDILDAQLMVDYTALRAYTGLAKTVRITGFLVTAQPQGIAGFFQFDETDTTSTDNGGTIIVGADSRRWKRVFDGFVNIKWFGAKGDGVSDDTGARNRCFTFTKKFSGTVYVPAGRYRVIGGFDNPIEGENLSIVGDGVDLFASNASNADGSCFILDSIDPASYFYSQSGANQLNVYGVQFACAQYVLDRRFFVTSASPIKQQFENCHFSAVEQPFVFEAGTYFQMNSYQNIRFTNSGTFHSRTSSLIATFMVLINVDVEETVPENSEKIICNFDGIRQIYGTNFVIEPATPSTGWTALKLRNLHDPAWTKSNTATFNGLWVEVTGNGLTYSIDQESGRSLFVDHNNNNGVNAPIKLSNSAHVEFKNRSFSQNADNLEENFEFNGSTCHVKLSGCTYRNPGNAITHPQITLENCTFSPSGGVDLLTATAHSNARSTAIWEFDGGYPDHGKVTVGAFGGSQVYPSTNASFGRTLVVMPNAGAINAVFNANTKNILPVGSQVLIVIRGELPTIASGTLDFNWTQNGSTIAGLASYSPSSSGQAFVITQPITVTSANPSTFGFSIVASGASTNLLLHQVSLLVGKSLPSQALPAYPKNVITYASSAPVVGGWERGDIVYSNTPSAGGKVGFVCVATGTPGTWKAFGAIDV